MEQLSYFLDINYYITISRLLFVFHFIYTIVQEVIIYIFFLVSLSFSI